MDKLLAGVGKLRSDRPILTRRDWEWLNDSQLANDNDLVEQPELTRVLFMYPRNEEGAAQVVREGRAVDRLLADSSSEASIILPFSIQRLHWHELFISFKEKRVYHFEGFGEALSSNAPLLATTIAERFLSGGTGWQLVSSSDVYQTDGHNCGVWLQVARDCWLQYAASSSYGSCNFFAFMQAQLVEHSVSDVES